MNFCFFIAFSSSFVLFPKIAVQIEYFSISLAALWSRTKCCPALYFIFFAILLNSFQVIVFISFASLCFLGSLLYRPRTFVIFMNLEFRKWASLVAVLSEVEFGVNLNAPQITT